MSLARPVSDVVVNESDGFCGKYGLWDSVGVVAAVIAAVSGDAGDWARGIWTGSGREGVRDSISCCAPGVEIEGHGKGRDIGGKGTAETMSERSCRAFGAV